MSRTERDIIRDIGREMQDDSSNRMRVQSARMPSVVASEEKIAEQAPAALQKLKQYGAMDLAEMLGLTPHMEGAN